MAWRKPEDLELVAECETLPELEIIRALLSSSGIESTSLTSADAAKMFAHKSIWSAQETAKPYKLLVHPEDAQTARDIIAAPAEEYSEDMSFEENEDD